MKFCTKKHMLFTIPDECFFFFCLTLPCAFILYHIIYFTIKLSKELVLQSVQFQCSAINSFLAVKDASQQGSLIHMPENNYLKILTCIYFNMAPFYREKGKKFKKIKKKIYFTLTEKYYNTLEI